jgi:hypothetical protein
MNTYDVVPKLTDFTTEELVRVFAKYLRRLNKGAIANTIEDGSWLTILTSDDNSPKLVADPDALRRNRLAPVREH